MKKWIFLVLAVCVVIGVYFWVSSSKSTDKKTKIEKPKSVKAFIGPLLVKVEATGTVVPEQEIEIKCKASGEIIKLPVSVSDKVKKGDLLVQLDPEDEKRNVKRAEVNLTVSESRKAQAKLQLEVAKNNLESEKLRANAALTSAGVKAKDAIARLERQMQLFKKNIASKEEYDAAKSVAAQADATLKDSQARVKDLKTKELQLSILQHDITIAEQQVAADKIALADARRRLKDTTVTSPIDGVVATCNVQVGQIIASGVSNVGGGTSVLTLSDIKKIYVLVYVDESDIGNIKVGQKAIITVDAYRDEIMEGSVCRVATKGQGSSNIVTFEVKVEVTGTGKNLLKQGMTANVSIITVDKPDALLLPVDVVTWQDSKTFVFIGKDGKKSNKTNVKVGESDNKNIEIFKGIKEGDEVFYPDKEEAGEWSKAKDSNKRKD